MQEAGTPVLSLHPQIALLPLVGQGHPAVLCCVTLCSHSSCLQGLASANFLALFQPHFFPVLPLILLLLHKPLCPSPLALCGSPADPGSFGCLLSISASLSWKASGSTGRLGDLGTLSLWWGAALAGGHVGLSPRHSGALGAQVVPAGPTAALAMGPCCISHPVLLQGVHQF